MREGLLVAGKYKLLKLIGTGGMGSVWLSRNEMTEREFAIKFLHPAAATNPKVLTRFLQEAKVSGRLRHPSILEIFDVGIAPELDNAPFLVMELLGGAPLDVAIRTLGTLPLRLTLQIGLAMSRALSVAHDKGVVHRDIKPANVFLHESNSGALVPKLLDFGISKLSPLELSGESSMGLTQTGAVLGSPLYMSPEQAAGDKHVDGRSDIHALGVLLWWCISGKSPFKSTTYNTLVVEIITGERPRLSDVVPDVPRGVSDLVTKAFARRREDRFENTAKLTLALEAQLSLLGPGPSLESGVWVDEIFAKLRAVQSMPLPAASTGPNVKEESTTTGAVSVSLDDVIEQSMRSPAAYTMDSKRSIALAPTEAAASTPSTSVSTTAARAVSGQTMLSGTQAAARRTVPLVWVAAAGLVILGALGVTGIVMSRRGDAPINSGAAALPPPPATSVATSSPAASTAPPAPVASAQASREAAPTASAPVVSATPTQSATHVPPVPTYGGRQPPPVKQPPPSKPPTPPTSDPFRGVGPGLL